MRLVLGSFPKTGRICLRILSLASASVLLVPSVMALRWIFSHLVEQVERGREFGKHHGHDLPTVCVVSVPRGLQLNHNAAVRPQPKEKNTAETPRTQRHAEAFTFLLVSFSVMNYPKNIRSHRSSIKRTETTPTLRGRRIESTNAGAEERIGAAK